MTEDTSTGAQTAPLTLDRYVYACDDPMSVVDPTGHFEGPPPNYATLNKSPNPVGQLYSDISNWWSGLPPETKVGIVVVVVCAAAALTGGAALVAAPEIGAAVGGSALLGATGQAIVSGSVAAAAIVPVTSAAASVTSYAISSGNGATINGALAATSMGFKFGESSVLEAYNIATGELSSYTTATDPTQSTTATPQQVAQAATSPLPGVGASTIASDYDTYAYTQFQLSIYAAFEYL